MCSGSEFSSTTTNPNMAPATVQDEEISILLELAADNNIEGFKSAINGGTFSVTAIGSWYCRRKGSKRIALDQRTPLMVAATYGSVDVLAFILSLEGVDVNFSCGRDRTTALHCAASGGSSEAVSIVKMLLSTGGDPNRLDCHGYRPFDLIVVHPKLSAIRGALECLLTDGSPNDSNSPVFSSSPENEFPPASEKKEYPIDPSFPDIKNSIYATDEFRMYSFKVRPCSRAYSHDWTECPFVHPGENARRRDPRKFHYSCVPCPEFRKGTCRRSDMCEYAHGVFECWLHPAQYRTRLCKDGTSCNRRVCFFAHTSEELRPLYVSTGSAVPSPRSSASVMDMAAALNLLPGSPSGVSALSPPANGVSAWPPAPVPTLHLPGSSLQSSRLRASVNARDILAEDVNLLEAQQQLINASLNRSGRVKPLAPSNLEELFAAEMSSPRYGDQGGGGFSPKFHQRPAMLSPINTSVFSPKSIDHPLLQASFGLGSPGRMSPRGMEPISPMSSRLAVISQREKQLQQIRTLSPRELGPNIVGSSGSSWPKWGSPTGQADWSVHGDALNRMQQASLDPLGDEPDVSWVQSLVKESPELLEKKRNPVPGVPNGGASTEIDSVIESWLEQMQMDKQQVVA